MDAGLRVAYEDVAIAKLVPGGQGLGNLADGKKVFVWNALPGETVRVRIIRQRQSYAEGIAEEVVRTSDERAVPRETNYLATSPWQMMTFAAENKYKELIVREIYEQAKVALPQGYGLAAAQEVQALPTNSRPDEARHQDLSYSYRNKMEYSFWGDGSGLHLALHQRGSHGKQIVQGSALAIPALDVAANSVCQLLDTMHMRAGDLKTIIVRCDQAGRTVAALFAKTEQLPDISLPNSLMGMRVYYSNPKSPASVPTKLLHEYGTCQLEDSLLGRPFRYDVDSFFQVNVPVFELALRRIADFGMAESITDMYAGVGSIGLSVARQAVDLVEIDPATASMARRNAAGSGLKAAVIETPAEKALEYITSEKPVIFDPPRAGLHEKVTAKAQEVKPPQIIYLSCNPVTQARDIAALQEVYVLDHFEAYNFFPRTPHIETLAILRRKN